MGCPSERSNRSIIGVQKPRWLKKSWASGAKRNLQSSPLHTLQKLTPTHQVHIFIIIVLKIQSHRGGTFMTFPSSTCFQHNFTFFFFSFFPVSGSYRRLFGSGRRVHVLLSTPCHQCGSCGPSSLSDRGLFLTINSRRFLQLNTKRFSSFSGAERHQTTKVRDPQQNRKGNNNWICF